VDQAQAGETPQTCRKLLIDVFMYILTHCPNRSEKFPMLSGLSKIRLKLTWPECQSI